nr:MAG TPA: hypothetical protein [Caudoviricetes sp.]
MVITKYRRSICQLCTIYKILTHLNIIRRRNKYE